MRTVPPRIHPAAIVEPGAIIGARTRVWAFVHVLPKATIGEDCNICDHVLIEGGVVVGNRVTVKSGVQLWTGVTLEDDVFVGPNVTFTNDRFPRSKRYPQVWAKTRVGRGATIGANATILTHSIGINAMVGAGSVVTQDVPPHAIVAGNPARITGYVATSGTSRLEGSAKSSPENSERLRPLAVKRARLMAMPQVNDLRGSLTYGEYRKQLPFVPKRYFVTFDVPGKEIRGESAHQQLQQFLVCLRGSVRVMLDDGVSRDEVVLDAPDLGLYVPPMTWTARYRYSADATLLALASRAYEPKSYIRAYEEFLRLTRRRR